MTNDEESMDRTSEQQQTESAEPATMNFDRPHGAPTIERSHALMDADVAAIVFGGKLLEGDNLFNVCASIVETERRRVLAQDAAQAAAQSVATSPRGRPLVEFLEPSATLGEVAAVSVSLFQSGVANVPAWQLDEHGTPVSIAIYARGER